jgi:hypothetical protein
MIRYFSRLCLLFLCTTVKVYAQEIPIPRSDKGYAIAGINAGWWQFTGDVATSKFAASPVNFHFFGGYAFNTFTAELGYTNGSVLWNQRSLKDPANFKSTLDGTQLIFNYLPLQDWLISPMFGVGIGYAWFSSFTDLKNESDKPYWYWTDGTIRDISEFSNTPDQSKVLKRDYSYESPLAIDQTSLYFPVRLGIQGRFSRNLSFRMNFEWMLLQSDNMDRNTTTSSWDHLKRISTGITWNFAKPPKRIPASVSNVPPKPVDYSSVDFKKLLSEDEDADGIPDSDDWCYGTAKGAPVDKHGCVADADADGIPDYLDKEIGTPANTWVNNQGISLTDEEIQAQYNDSLSYFVSALRKYNRNSRPFPVKKFIPEENYVKFANMLELHPEWKTVSRVSPRILPAELRLFDLNRDELISMEELQQAAHRLLDGKDKALNSDLLIKAINYAFQDQ